MIKITASDICTQAATIEQVLWERDPQIEAVFLPNVVTANNDNLNDCLEFVVNGAESYHIYIYNNTGILIHNKTGNMQGQVCVWDPEPYEYATGVYMWIADFWNSCGYEISTHGFFTLFNGGANKNILEPSDKNEFLQNASFYVFPNPAKDKLTLVFAIKEDAEILLIDTWGREVLRMELNSKNETVVPLYGIAAGVYYIRVRTKTGVSTKKILIYD